MAHSEGTGSTAEPDDGRDPQASERHHRLLAQYLDRLNAGERIDPLEVIADHPEEGEELLEELEAFLRAVPGAGEGGALRTLGDYTLRRRIGRGGMGIVYEAWENSMDRRVALKVLPSAVAADQKTFLRFCREARLAGRLHHPNIVPVFGMGIKGDTPHYAMEFVEGETLAQVLTRLRRASGPDGSGAASQDVLQTVASLGIPTMESGFAAEDVTPPYCYRVAEAFAGVAEGLQHAHSKGIIHRDLKPSNLILDQDGRLRVLDFGLAHLEGLEGLTRTGDFLGTVLYMSPEQALARRVPVDHRTDIYSLGATLYEMLVWRPPFQGKDQQETVGQIISREPRPVRRMNRRVPADLDTIVLRCLRKDPADRYRTAEALAQDLRRFARGDPIEARPEAGWEKLSRQLRRHRGKLWAGAALCVLLTVFGWLAHDRKEALREARRAAYEAVVLDVATELYRGQLVLGGDELFNLYSFKGRSFKGREARLSWEDAAIRLAAVAEAVPERPEAGYYLARLRRFLGEDEAAIREAARAVEADPAFAPAEVLREEVARKAFRLGDDVLEGILERYRASGGWQEPWLLAYRHGRDKRWPEAAGAYSRIIRWREERGAEPYLGSAVEAIMGRGLARLRSGNLEGAIRDFAAARSLWPRFPEAGLLLGKAYWQKGDPDEAERVFSEVHEDSPGEARSDLAIWVACVYRLLGDREKRDAWLGKAGEPARLRASAFIHDDEGRTEEAAEEFRAVLEKEPHDLHALVGLGFERLCLQEERFGPEWDRERSEILALAHRAVDLYPRDPTARAVLAEALVATGDLEAAEAEAKKVIELQTQGGDEILCMGPVILGDVLREQGEFERAEESIREGLKSCPGHPLFRSRLAKTLKAAGKLGEALAEYEGLARGGPGSAVGHAGTAAVLVQMGRYEEAIDRARRATELPPRNTPAHESLAFALWKLGRFPEALAAAGAGIEAVPGRVGPVLARGLALEALGEIESAVRSYCQAIELCPESPEADTALSGLLERDAGARALPELKRLEETLAARAPRSRNGAPILKTLSTLRGASPEENGPGATGE